MKKNIITLIVALVALGTNAFAQKSNVIHLSKAEFIEKVYNFESNDKEWIYKGDKPAIIDFYADWCGPCRKLSPILEEIATERKEDIYIYKVNTDKEPAIATAFGIRALPTLIFIPIQGTPSATEGFIPKEELCKMIDSFLFGSKLNSF